MEGFYEKLDLVSVQIANRNVGNPLFLLRFQGRRHLFQQKEIELSPILELGGVRGHSLTALAQNLVDLKFRVFHESDLHLPSFPVDGNSREGSQP